MRRLVFMMLMLWPVAGNALAQQEEAPPEAPAGNQVQEQIAPYDTQLLRLAEVLGAIHHLRGLCGAKEGNKWRDAMSGIIASEAPQPKRKARLIARFNRGFRSFDETYTVCTPSALLAAERYRKEGVRLANRITGRYGR